MNLFRSLRASAHLCQVYGHSGNYQMPYHNLSVPLVFRGFAGEKKDKPHRGHGRDSPPPCSGAAPVRQHGGCTLLIPAEGITRHTRVWRLLSPTAEFSGRVGSRRRNKFRIACFRIYAKTCSPTVPPLQIEPAALGFDLVWNRQQGPSPYCIRTDLAQN